MAGKLILFALGLGVLYAGATLFIRGASAAARLLGVSPFVIGMTVVGFGTSAPELSVNLSAAWRGTADLALGNVVGSNIANIGLILGAAALLSPLKVRMRLLKVEAPLMLGASILLWLLAMNGTVGRIDGLLLLAGLVAFGAWLATGRPEEPAAVREELSRLARVKAALGKPFLFLLAGLVGLVGGARLMVDSAVSLARLWGVSDLVIGLTVVAVGTSLPELASTLVAARRDEDDIALGNVIGSNLFNILLVLGCTATIHPLPAAPRLVRVELPVMVGFAAILLPFMGREMRVSRGEGAFLLAGYLGFLAWLALAG